MTNKHSKVFTYSGFFSISMIYIVVLIITLISFILIKFDTTFLIVLLCIFTFIYGLLALIIYLVSRHIAKVDEQTKLNLEKGKYNTPKRGGF